MEFSKNDYSIILYKDENESDEIFYNRGLFIINQKNLKNLDLNYLIKLSKIWANIKYKECKYSSSLMNEILNLEKNIT